MSFWPFSNALNNNAHLQKFLESLSDFSSVTAEDIVSDPELSQELLAELQNIQGSYESDIDPLQFQQQPQQPQQQGNVHQASDATSITSSNEYGSLARKDTLSKKLVDLLIQPHILNGFLDYVVKSVDFFSEIGLREDQVREKEIESFKNSESFSPLGDVLNDRSEVEAQFSEGFQLSDSVASQGQHSDEQEGETEEEKMRRCIQVASDILSSELWIISNRIIETPIIMDKLWKILSLPNIKESSPSTAYIVHILDQLMDNNTVELLNYVRHKDDLVDVFVGKIEVPMIMDFLLRVIQTDKPDCPTGIVEVLWRQKLIPKLIDIIKPVPNQFETGAVAIANYDLFFQQTAATDFIKALITISSNSALAVALETNIGPNSLTRELISPKIVKEMILDIMLYKVYVGEGKYMTNKHGINNCVSIVIELIRKNNSDYDLNYGSYNSLLQENEGLPGEVNCSVMFQWLKDFDENPPGPRDPLYLGELLTLFSDYLDDFAELMDLDEVPMKNMEDSNVLGFTKFKISELIAELLHCSNMILLNSKKIRKIISVRDLLRDQRYKRIEKALVDDISSKESDANESVNEVTHFLDDVSLMDIVIGDSNGKRKDQIDIPRDSKSLFKECNVEPNLEILDDEEDLEDVEPKISPEDPFVSEERDTLIRKNPSVGDRFKIKLFDSGILSNIISKFTSYPWHNFFHNVVFDLIQQIFNGKLNSYNSFLIVDLFKMGKMGITEIILNYYKSDVIPRPGYMGHLILISEEIVKFTSLYKPDLISPLIMTAIQSPSWEDFVNEVLYKTRETYNAVLGSEDYGDYDKDEDGEFRSGKPSGYMDLNCDDEPDHKVILLGESSNHDAFINDKSALREFHEEEKIEDRDEEDEADEKEAGNMSASKVPDVKLEDIHLIDRLQDADSVYFENEEDGQEDEYLETLSGSSSSSDEDYEDNGLAENNELCRVPNHRDKSN